MFRVGLTGGIASGKTTVAGHFQALGVPIIDADQAAREVVAPGSEGLRRLTEAFGEEILTPHGELDRPRMRERIFAQPPLRRRLEAILHPLIRQTMWAEAKRHPDAPYHLFVIPLLLEKGGWESIDRVLVVDCPEALQLRRVIQRDGIPQEQARRILAAQMTRQRRRALADDIIDNSGGPEGCARQVARLHQNYLTLAGAARRGRAETKDGLS